MNSDNLIESEIIGALLKYPSKILEIDINRDMFMIDRNKVIYDTIMQLVLENNQVTESVIYNLTKEKDVTISYLMEVRNSAIQVLNTHVDMLKKQYQLSQLRLLGKGMHNLDCSVDTQEIIERVQEKLFNIQRDINKGDNGSTSEALENVLSSIEEGYKEGGQIRGIKTKLVSLDTNLNGLRKKNYYVIAARPSMGKTALCIQMLIDIAILEDYKAAFFSLEMGKEEILERIISNVAAIDYRRIQRGELRENEWTELIRVTNKISNKKNFRIYENKIYIEDIETQCKILKEQNQLDIIFIDYLTKIDTSRDIKESHNKYGYISGRLKHIARTYDIPVVCLSQINRNSETRMDKRPTMAELRASGDIEQDADVVMLLYRDAYYDAKATEDIMEIIIDKSRNGVTGTVKVRFIGQMQRVKDLYA